MCRWCCIRPQKSDDGCRPPAHAEAGTGTCCLSRFGTAAGADVSSDSAAPPCCAYSVPAARIKNGDRQRVPVPGTSCPCRGKACQKPAFLVSPSTGICTGRDWHSLPVPVWDRGGGNHVEVTWPRCQVERTRCKACIKNGDRQRVPVPGASRQCRGKACQKPAFLVSPSTGICTGRDWHLLPVPVWDRGGGNHVEVTWPRCQVERTRCKACIKNGDRQRVPVPGASRQCRGKACQKPAFFVSPSTGICSGRDWHLLPVPVRDRGEGNHVEVTWPPKAGTGAARCRSWPGLSSF